MFFIFLPFSVSVKSKLFTFNLNHLQFGMNSYSNIHLILNSGVLLTITSITDESILLNADLTLTRLSWEDIKVAMPLHPSRGLLFSRRLNTATALSAGFFNTFLLTKIIYGRLFMEETYSVGFIFVAVAENDLGGG